MKKYPVYLQSFLLFFFLLSALSLAAYAAPAQAKTGKAAVSEHYPITMTIHGRLFPLAFQNTESLNLATAEGTYYRLEGPLKKELQQKIQELGKKEIWLSGEKTGSFIVDKSIKGLYDDKGCLTKRYKEITEFWVFNARAIEKIGDTVEIKAPEPRIESLSDEETRMISQSAPIPPGVVIQLNGIVIAAPRKKIPVKMLTVRTGDPMQPFYQIMLTSDTRVFTVLSDERAKKQELITDPDAIKNGDRIQAFIVKKKNVFEAVLISILK